MFMLKKGPEGIPFCMPFYMDEKTQRAIKKFPERATDIVRSFETNKIVCKQWLIDKLKDLKISPKERIFIAGGWYGNVLVPELKALYDAQIKLHDIDPITIRIAKEIYHNDDSQVRCQVVDSHNFEYKDMVINTSCEHMKPLNIRKKAWVILQSNNYRSVDDHINCVDSPQELANQYELSEVFYAGVIQFELYNRYMVIGKK